MDELVESIVAAGGPRRRVTWVATEDYLGRGYHKFLLDDVRPCDEAIAQGHHGHMQEVYHATSPALLKPILRSGGLKAGGGRVQGAPGWNDATVWAVCVRLEKLHAFTGTFNEGLVLEATLHGTHVNMANEYGRMEASGQIPSGVHWLSVFFARRPAVQWLRQKSHHGSPAGFVHEDALQLRACWVAVDRLHVLQTAALAPRRRRR